MLRAMQIGYGYWGANVAAKLSVSKCFEFVSLAEPDDEKRARAAKRFPGIRVYRDYRDGFDDDIDVVIICTQTEYSYDIAMDAMKRGRHIFIEKPLAKNLEKANELVRCAGENNVILHCDHLMIYNPVIRYIKKMIDNNEMGDLLYIDVVRANLGPIRKDINALLDLAVHDIAVADYLLGGLSPEKMSAFGTNTVGEQDTLTYLTMKQNGVLININSSWISPVKIRRTTIAGSKKMCIFDDMKSDKLRIYDKGIEVTQGMEYGEYEFGVRSGDLLIPHIEFEDSLLNSLEHFGMCVNEGRSSLSGPGQCLRVMAVLEDALKELYGKAS
ncbi:MAG: Gfo/Idh/MocA family oxidoreductase [Eubacterium sp.]|nr:Gfo/Idh/MocA family oxidoreductase [Eubacterium sp.]